MARVSAHVLTEGVALPSFTPRRSPAGRSLDEAAGRLSPVGWNLGSPPPRVLPSPPRVATHCITATLVGGALLACRRRVGGPLPTRRSRLLGAVRVRRHCQFEDEDGIGEGAERQEPPVSEADDTYTEYSHSNELVENRGGPAQIDVLLPSPDEMVNADIPNHYLQVYRRHRTNNVKPGPGRSKGRSKKSKQKVEWRLKQGSPLAHNNWNFPSRIRISAGLAKRRRLEQPDAYIRPMMRQVRKAVFDQLTAMHLFEDRSVRVLDLFAGTGSAGIEALSRGASECIFVDSSQECIDCSIANAWLSGFMEHEEAAKGPMNERSKAETEHLLMVGGPRAKVQIQLHQAQVSRQPVGGVLGDVYDVLEHPEKYGLQGRKFNLILASPPYNEISYRQFCTALAKTELLERDGFVAMEYPRELGVLPPILCAPFEDPEDYDDIVTGVPMLYGLRNRRYGNTVLAIYSKLPTGARGRPAEPRPHEFVEELIQRKLRKRSRELWRTPSLFRDDGERGFAVPQKPPKLEG